MPHRPTIDPTDRSMPPVMMTKVMPMARKALSATCFDISTKFAEDRKFGATMREEDDHGDERDEGAQPSSDGEK